MINYTIIELSIISALLSLFLDFCFREGHVFAWWLDMWADFFLGKKKIKYPKDVNKRDYKFSQVESIFWKPLGGCVVCSNVWVSLTIGLVYLTNWSFILVILFSHFLVRLTHGRLL